MLRSGGFPPENPELPLTYLCSERGNSQWLLFL